MKLENFEKIPETLGIGDNDPVSTEKEYFNSCARKFIQKPNLPNSVNLSTIFSLRLELWYGYVWDTFTIRIFCLSINTLEYAKNATKATERTGSKYLFQHMH